MPFDFALERRAPTRDRRNGDFDGVRSPRSAAVAHGPSFETSRQSGANAGCVVPLKSPFRERPETSPDDDIRRYRRAIEGYAGTVRVPVGLAGPLRVRGRYAAGDYQVPLATTEAALVASYRRGARAITEAGGCNALLLEESISRTPCFVFADAVEAFRFADWARSRVADFVSVAARTTAHGRLANVDPVIEGNHVYLDLAFKTAEAAGQNMVTMAADAVCAFIQAQSPVSPRLALVEGNLCGDKKASMRSFTSVRGKRVTADVVLPADLVARRLHVSPEEMVECWRICAMGSALSGTIGAQGHFANGLAAVYLACGQDIACVSESAVGVTRFEVDETGNLYAAVTLPNVVVGTVGGGTALPDQCGWLDRAGLAGADSARAFAEICAALCLAGELSLIAAIRSGDFVRAHEVLRRKCRDAGSAARMRGDG